MTKIKVTPETVVEAYAKTGLTPCFGVFNHTVKDGVHTVYEQDGRAFPCCALTVLSYGREADYRFDYTISANFFTLFDLDDVWSFVDGFDGRQGGRSYVTKDYELGKACREAVLARFPDTPQ